MRHGAARGRRPLLRRAGDEGVRGGVRPGPARTHGARASTPCRARCSGRSRTSTRRSSPSRASRPAPGADACKRVVEAPSPTGARRSRTRSRSPGVASRDDGVAALAAIGHDRRRPRRGARARGVRRARGGAVGVNGWREAQAAAKINLALVVGPLGTTACTRSRRCSSASTSRTRSRVEPADVDGRHGLRGRHARARRARRGLRGCGRRAALARRASRSGSPSPRGSAAAARDAATALRLANALLDEPLSRRASSTGSRAALGSDVPFFLGGARSSASGRRNDARARSRCRRTTGPARASERVTRRRRPALSTPRSTSATGERGFAERRAVLRDALAHVARRADLAALPPNDLATLAAGGRAPRARRVPRRRQRGGPAVYGLFANAGAGATRAAGALGAAPTLDGSAQLGTVDRDVRSARHRARREPLRARRAPDDRALMVALAIAARRRASSSSSGAIPRWLVVVLAVGAVAVLLRRRAAGTRAPTSASSRGRLRSSQARRRPRPGPRRSAPRAGRARGRARDRRLPGALSSSTALTRSTGPAVVPRILRPCNGA